MARQYNILHYWLLTLQTIVYVHAPNDVDSIVSIFALFLPSVNSLLHGL